MDKEIKTYFKRVEAIDFALFAISQIQEELAKITPKNTLDAMIDNATGFGSDRVKELKNLAIYNIKTIIKNKNKLGYSTESEQKMLDQLRS